MSAFDASARDRLVGNPATFLDAVGIMVSGAISNATNHNQAEPLTLVYRPHDEGYREHPDGRRVRVPCYLLTKANGGVSFPSYIADYAQGATTQTTLGTAANLCFTANMNGCTFGIGIPSPDGSSQVVTHGNAAGSAGMAGLSAKTSQAAVTAVQTSLQYSGAKQALGVGAQVFEPEHYRVDGKQSITFGWRTATHGWRFYFLSYRRQYGIVTNYGVNPVQTNQITA